MMNPVYSPAPNRYEGGIRYRRCGRSGIRLPEISLGLWHNFGDVNPLDRSFRMAHYAIDHGIVHFDLANNYGPSYGSAEETFGQIMKKSSVLTPEMLSRLKALNAIAQRRGQTLAQMALAWCLKDDLVTSVIIGASSVAQLEDNFRALENTVFSQEELQEINAVCHG